MFDLGIIGGGPAGYVAAERAGAKGLNVVIFEKKTLGGVCLNEGCIPTKTMLYSAKLYDYARHGEKYGVNVENASIDYRIILKRKEKVVKKLVGAVKVAMRDNGVTVVNAEAVIKGRDAEGVISIAAGEESYEVRNLLICTGSEAFVPPIPGLAEAGDIICTNREILALTEPPQELVIIGGGVIGMEFASFFNSIGTKVTVVEMLPKILGNLDNEVSAKLQAMYARKGVAFNLGCKVVAIEGNTVVFVDPQGETQRVSGDRILVSVGRRANINGVGLESIGVVAERGIKVDDHMRTNVPNVYAAGDVTGFSLLAHTASREAEVAVNNMLGREDVMSYDAIPGIVYTNPEVAGVGLTEEAAAASGLEYAVVSLPMQFSGRFVAENDGGDGICKVIVNKKDNTVLGVHMLGNPCSEIIISACIAIEKKMTLEQLKDVVFPHPTVSEILKESFFAVK